MAENIKINVDVDDNGSTKKRVKDAESLKKAYDNVKQSSKEATKEAAAGAKTTAAINAAMSTKTTKAVKSASQSSSENLDYGVARGSVGTGAAGRDFAKQAQGLGGLVHVYATFAANLFAVSAAFSALSSAADTTNMVKGLEQLGAATGTNLGLMSKNLVEATDGAISLKDAMRATAQATAAGMSGENLKKLGVVARQTSAALGIDATDAINRLSRGITKLEPELLDELGLFTKIGKATSDYAREVGKPISALTDFERRQAFANAVLKEAEDKFGNIKIDANPYSKLLASLKDTTQTMMEFVNKGIGPVVKALSQSPNTLMLGIAALTGLLLKQSIPALTQWGTQLHQTAEQNRDAAARTKELFEAYVDSNKQQAEKRVSDTVKSYGAAAKLGIEEARKQLKSGARLYNKDFNAMMKLDVEQLTPDHHKVIEATRAKLQAAVTKAQTVSPEKAEAAAARLDTFNKVSAAMTEAIDKQAKYNEGVQKTVPNLSSMEAFHKRVAASAEMSAKKYTILANAIDNTKFVGPVAAWSSMLTSIKALEGNITSFGKAWLTLKGTLTIAATGIGMVVGAMGNVLSLIGMVVGGLSALTIVFSKNSDEAERSSSSLAALKSNGEVLLKTFDLLEKSSPLEKLSPRAVAAATNAMQEVASSMLKAMEDTEKTIQARGTVDSITNWLAGWIGKSDEKKLSSRLNKELTQILELSAKTPQSAKIKIDLVKMLGLGDDATTAEIIKQFEAMGVDAAKVLEKLTKEQNVASQSSVGFANSLKETAKQMQDLENDLKFTDKLSLFANKSMKDFSELNKVLEKDTVSAFSAVLELVKNPEALVMLPKGMQNSIVSVIPDIEKLGESFSKNQDSAADAAKGLEIYTKNLEEARQAIAENEKATTTWQTRDAAATAKEKLPGLEMGVQMYTQQLKQANERVAVDTGTIGKYTELFKKASAEGFTKSSDIIASTLGTAMQKAAISTQQAALSTLPQTESIIKKQADLANQQINLDIAQINSQSNLILELRALRLEVEDAKIQEAKKAEATEKGYTGTSRAQFLAEPTPRQVEIESERTAIKTKGKGFKSPQQLADVGVEKGASIELFEIFGKTAGDIAKLQGQKVINSLNANVKVIDKKFSDQIAEVTKQSDAVAFDLDQLSKQGVSPEIRQLPEYQEKFAKYTKELIDLDKQRVNLGDSRLKSVQAAVGAQAGLNSEQKKELVGEYARLKAIEEQKIAQTAANRLLDSAQKNINDKYEIGTKEAEQALFLSKSKLQIDQDTLDRDRQDLDIQVMLGKIYGDQLAQAQASLSIRQAEKDYAESLLDIENNRESKLKAIAKEMDLAKAAKGGSLSTAEEKTYLDRQDREKDNAKTLIEQAKRLKDLKLDSANASLLLSNREEAYAEAFKNAFKSMEDAIVEFTKTGKMSFTSMINSFIEDLLRYEIRQQQQAFMQSMGGAGGIVKGILNAVGIGSGSLTPDSRAGMGGGSNNNPDFTMDINAKGGVYGTYGVEAFAKGGTFTNSIVNSPTLFKFAKGTGLMGEAGPEAIMPLKRDAQGNLGVRAGGTSSGGEVSVVVNNYSGEKASTKETTDSRGNRKIEVIVGEMVAQEMTRTGSSTQTAMTNTFGSRPALARR